VLLLLLSLVLSLTLRPALARAEQGEAPVQIAQTGSAADEPAAGAEDEDLEAAAGGARVAPPPGVEVIRITGRPMAAIETDVPESATQFDTAVIEALGAQNVADLAKVSPNVEIRVAGATAPVFFIRGVGLSDFNANAAGAVSVYQDEVAINAPAIQIGQLYDVQNIEVLRGPQGGGSGRNASAGAIKMYSRKPTGQLAAEMRTNLGSYASDHARDAFTQDYEGAIEIPLVEDMLATRLAFRLSQRDPYATNGCGGNPLSQYQSPRQPGGLPMIPLDPGPDGVFGPNPRGGYETTPPPESLTIFHPPGPNDDIGRTDTNGDFGEEPARIYAGWTGRVRGKPEKFCGEGSRFLVQNQDFFVPNPPTDRELPQSYAVSPVPSDLPIAVNDAGAWAARGQLRFQPPGTEMDWMLNLHGSRLDQLSTLGQAMGTRGGSPGELGTLTSVGYREPDHKEMQDAIWEEVREQYPDLEIGQQTDIVLDKLANQLARNLDIRPNRGDYNRVGRTTLDAWGGFVRGDAAIGPVNFTSISAYDTYDRFREQDQDFTPDVLFETISTDEAWQFSQELRLAGELADTPLRWEAGGYYLMEQLSAHIDTFLAQENQSPVRDYDQDLWSFAVYGGFRWDFLDDFTLEGGVRYNWERKDFDFGITVPAKHGGETLHTVESATWQAPTGTLSLTYRFNEDVSAYWKYSRGWKGGHFNAAALSALNEQGEFRVEPVEPEVIDAFEVGLRGRFLDGRLGLGLAFFYYAYANYQVFVVQDDLGAAPSYIIKNANDAEVYGGELDLRAEPLVGWVPQVFDQLVLTGRLGWLESQFLDFTDEVYRIQQLPNPDQGPPLSRVLPVLVDYSGNQLINSPRLKASLSAEWTFDLGRWGALIPRYDFAWSDDIFFDPSEGLGSPDPNGDFLLPEYAVGQRAFSLHNVRLAYRTPAGNMEIAGWVRNLTDEVYKTYAFDASVFSGVVLNFVGEPRTWGVSLSVNW
jgi:outer membrane receptor protein involved in Fe transport